MAGKEGAKTEWVTFIGDYISSWPGLDTHLFELGPSLKLQCALVMRFITNSPNHSISMQKDLNKLIWRDSHAVFEWEGVTHTYVRSRICVSWDLLPSKFPLVILTNHRLSTPSTEIPKNNHSFQKTHQPNSVAWSRLAMEMLFRPVYSGSWICMEKFNSENSSRTYRRELNAPILTDSTDCETTTDAWQPSVRQSGRKEHEFLPLGVQGSTRRGSSESSRMRDGSARGRWLWRGRSWAQSAFPWQDHRQIFIRHSCPALGDSLIRPKYLIYWE